MYFEDQNIVKDFDQFINYLETEAPLFLTKNKRVLKATILLELNTKMLTPVVLTKNRPTQKDFIYLNFFFYVSLVAELFTIQHERKGPILNIRSERIQLYQAMNADEQYAFLLQTFWCYLDWELAFDRRPSFEVGQLFQVLEEVETSKLITFKSTTRPLLTNKILVELLRAFGLLEYTLSTDARWQKSVYIAVETITLSAYGQKILPLLSQKRPIYLWGELDPYLTESRSERIYGPIDSKEDLPLELMDFFAVLKPDFPDLSIKNRLYPIIQEPITGELILKVLLTPKCYRTIRVSAAVTFEDLHLAIQEIFHFDNDHLYAFFLNGMTVYKAGNVFADPRGMIEDPEYPADLISLGEVGLYPGKELLYLFDFGDDWQFLIQVLAIENTSELESSSTFKLIESKGESPEQYPEW